MKRDLNIMFVCCQSCGYNVLFAFNMKNKKSSFGTIITCQFDFISAANDFFVKVFNFL